MAYDSEEIINIRLLHCKFINQKNIVCTYFHTILFVGKLLKYTTRNIRVFNIYVGLVCILLYWQYCSIITCYIFVPVQNCWQHVCQILLEQTLYNRLLCSLATILDGKYIHIYFSWQYHFFMLAPFLSCTRKILKQYRTSYTYICTLRLANG